MKGLHINARKFAQKGKDVRCLLFFYRPLWAKAPNNALYCLDDKVTNKIIV